MSRVNHLHKHIEKGSLLKKKVPTSLMLLELTKADHNRTSWISAHLLYSPSLHIELTSCGTFSTDVAQILLMYSFTVGLPVSHLVSRPVSDASTHTIYKGSSSRFRGVRYIFCWGTVVTTHTHTHTLFSCWVRRVRDRTLLCFCPGLQRDMKEHQKKQEIKSEKECGQESRRVQLIHGCWQKQRGDLRGWETRGSKWKGRAMGDKRWALTEKHSRESQHAPI